MGRGRFAIFVSALVGVPVVAAVVIGLAASHGDRPVLHVLLPFVAGAAAGALMCVVFARIGKRAQPTGGKGDIGGIGTTLIAGAALVGIFSSRLPVWLDALFAGWVLGYIVAFDALIVGWWRRDPKFRERVRALRAR